MIKDQDLFGIPHYEITEINKTGGEVRIAAKYTGPRACPEYSSPRLRNKGAITRVVRHTSWAAERVWLVLAGHRWKCYDCGRFPGAVSVDARVLPISSESFSLPAKDCIGLNLDQGSAPVFPDLRQGDPKQAVAFRQRGSLTFFSKGGELTSQAQVLKGDGLMTTTQQVQKPKQTQEGSRHGCDVFPPARSIQLGSIFGERQVPAHSGSGSLVLAFSWSRRQTQHRSHLTPLRQTI